MSETPGRRPRGPALRTSTGKIRYKTSERVRSTYRRKFIGIWGTGPLKKSIYDISVVEGRNVSQMACVLLRLGIGRYFELLPATDGADKLRKKIGELLETT